MKDTEIRPRRRRSLPEQVQDRAKKEPEVEKEIDVSKLIPTGSTMLNLACSDTPFGAYIPGGIVTTPGVSSAGKTFHALSVFAECNLHKRFDGYAFYYDDAEERMNINIKKIFGKKTAKRIEQPIYGYSKTIQAFESNMLKSCKTGKPFIYVLDSMDSLSSNEELEKEMRRALAMAKSDEAAAKIAGSFNGEKAKIMGQTLRMINNELKESDSLLIIIQQLRQKMNAGPFESKYCTSGGEAPFFYSNHQVMFSKGGPPIKKNNLEIGICSKAKVKKNSVTGKIREATFNIYYSYGIDDIDSCIEFLLDVGWWEKKGHTIIANELNLELVKSKLIETIVNESLERKLRRITGEAWLYREEEVEMKRKPRYE